MTVPFHAAHLKIYVGEKFFSKSIPAYEEILWEAKEMGLGGCTVIKCEMGYGHIGVTQSKEDEKHDDLPVLIEIVDSVDKIGRFAAVAAKILGNHGLILMQDATVLHQGSPHNAPPSPGHPGTFSDS